MKSHTNIKLHNTKPHNAKPHHKHIILAVSGIVVILAILVVSLMFAFRMCPPKGQWAAPPWCSGGIEMASYDNGQAYEEYNYSPLEYTGGYDRARDFSFGVATMDLWGDVCYLRHCEDNRKYVDSTIARLGQLGSDQMIVTDMAAMHTNLSMEFQDVGGSRSIDRITMDDIVRKAHRKNMSVFIMLNVYDGEPNARSSIDYESPSIELKERLLQEWEKILLEEAAKAEYAQADYLVVNPRDIDFFFQKTSDQVYMNNGIAEILLKVRTKYHGKLCVWGSMDNIDTPGLLNQMNCIILDEPVQKILYDVNDTHNITQIKQSWDAYLSKIDDRKFDTSKEIYVMLLMPSYKNATHHGWVEPVGIDYDKAGIKFDVDYQEQASVYEGLFRAVNDHGSVEGIISYGYWWTDRMYPESGIKILRNDISQSIRGKDAEDVCYEWNVLKR